LTRAGCGGPARAAGASAGRGGPRLRQRGRGQHPGEGGAGRPHGRTGRGGAPLLLGREQGVRLRGAPRSDRRAGRPRAPPPQLAARLPGRPGTARARRRTASPLCPGDAGGDRAARAGRRTVGRPVVRAGRERARPGAPELENYESDLELQLFREYRDVVSLFTYVIETERRFYLANQVDLQVRSGGGEVFYELRLADVWVWDIYRSNRFVRSVRVVTFKDVNIEELNKQDIALPSPRAAAHRSSTAPLRPQRRRGRCGSGRIRSRWPHEQPREEHRIHRPTRSR